MTHDTIGIPLTGRKAKFYDFENFFYGVHHITRQHTKLITMESGQRLLDVGCGTASTLHSLNQQWGKRVTLYGIDPSADMIDVAAQKMDGMSHVHLSVGVGETLEFEDDSFDWLLSCLTPHHLPQPARCQMFKECYRVLKGNGRFLISDFGEPVTTFARLGTKLWRHHAYVSEALHGEIFQQAEQAGFQIIDRQIQWGGIYHVLAQKPDSG